MASSAEYAPSGLPRKSVAQLSRSAPSNSPSSMGKLDVSYELDALVATSKSAKMSVSASVSAWKAGEVGGVVKGFEGGFEEEREVLKGA